MENIFNTLQLAPVFAILAILLSIWIVFKITNNITNKLLKNKDNKTKNKLFLTGVISGLAVVSIIVGVMIGFGYYKANLLTSNYDAIVPYIVECKHPTSSEVVFTLSDGTKNCVISLSNMYVNIREVNEDIDESYGELLKENDKLVLIKHIRNKGKIPEEVGMFKLEA